MHISNDVFVLIFMCGDNGEAKLLADVIKFENCFRSFIRIIAFCIFENKLTLLFCSEIM